MKIVQTDAAPTAIGPYSQAVVSGELVFTAGQIALDPATGELVPGGVDAQTHRVMANLTAVLEAAGSSLSHVVKTTVFLKDMADFPVMNEIYGSYFGTHRPARSTVQAARLPRDCAVEIECIAALSSTTIAPPEYS